MIKLKQLFYYDAKTILRYQLRRKLIPLNFLNNMEETQAYFLIIVFKNQDTTLGRELIITFKKCIEKKKYIKMLSVVLLSSTVLFLFLCCSSLKKFYTIHMTLTILKNKVTKNVVVKINITTRCLVTSQNNYWVTLHF